MHRVRQVAHVSEVNLILQVMLDLSPILMRQITHENLEKHLRILRLECG